MDTIKPLPETKTKSFQMGIKLENGLMKGLTYAILLFASLWVLIPLVFLFSTSIKDKDQLTQSPPPLLPWAVTTATVGGKERPMYEVTVNGQTMQMALIRKQPGGKALFADPATPEKPVELVVNQQTPLRHLEFHWENYPQSIKDMAFMHSLGNTLIVTFGGMLAMLFSCSLVAYGFSRFRAPWLNILFLALLSTIMLPQQVTLIPLYILFRKIGWVDTLLPLIIPQLFANAYDVFFLRQYFMSISLELDEAARIDGASPLQILWHIILPQSVPALVAVGVFHFLYAWNDFYQPLIYLQSPEKWTLAVGIQTLSGIYTKNTHLIMAASMLMVLPPIILYFISQRIFKQGVVFTGIKG
jgi:multiple sugar transport system permease protein